MNKPKTTPTKLQLKRETLRSLDETTLRQVAAGGYGTTSTSRVATTISCDC